MVVKTSRKKIFLILITFILLSNFIITSNVKADSPVANNDTVKTNKNIAIDINILANDVDNDGTINPTTVTIGSDVIHGATSINPATGIVTYIPNTNYVGSDSFTYTVKDNENETSNTAIVSITVNKPPVANAGGPYTASINQTITFDASASTDSDGTITGYRWDWTNDESYDTGWLTTSTIKHSYSASGLYTVKLKVRDNNDEYSIDNASVSIIIINQPPTADAGGPYIGIVNTLISIDGSNSNDPDGTITGYRWDWTNDGIYDTDWLSTSTTTHSYSSSGLYTINLEVKDNNDLYSNDSTNVSIIKNPQSSNHKPPVADAGGPYIANINQTITFDASKSTDSYDRITGYRWDWNNDGVYDTNWSGEPTTTYIYTTIGNYTVKLQVKDSFGAAAVDTTQVTILQENIKIKADAGGPYYEIIGIPIKFNGSKSFTLNGTILTCKWSFGDKNTSTSMMPTHTYYIDGNYTIILTITDNNNNIDTDTTYAIITKKPNHPPEKPTISGIISSHINTNCDYTIKAIDIDNDKIQYIINWNDKTNQTISPLLNNNTTFNTSHSWSTGGIYNIIIYTLDENNATSNNQNFTVLIDAYYLSNLGYLIDKNGDKTYDVFYNKTTGNETKIQKNINEYNIDINNDQEWDYKFNSITNKISEYKTSIKNESSILNIVLKGIPLTIAIILLVIYLFFLLKLTIIKNKNQQEKKPKLKVNFSPTKTNKIYSFKINDEKIKNEKRQEKKPILKIKEKYSPDKINKRYAFEIYDEKTKKMHDEIDKILFKNKK